MEDILEAILPFFLGGLALIMLIGLLIRGKKMIMYHPTLNITIVKRRGFSYTCCFFGPLVPLVRGHIAGFFLYIFISLTGIGALIMPFVYNKMYLNYLAKCGYVNQGVLTDETSVYSRMHINNNNNFNGQNPQSAPDGQPTYAQASNPTYSNSASTLSGRKEKKNLPLVIALVIALVVLLSLLPGLSFLPLLALIIALGYAFGPAVPCLISLLWVVVIATLGRSLGTILVSTFLSLAAFCVLTLPLHKKVITPLKAIIIGSAFSLLSSISFALVVNPYLSKVIIIFILLLIPSILLICLLSKFFEKSGKSKWSSEFAVLDLFDVSTLYWIPNKLIYNPQENCFQEPQPAPVASQQPVNNPQPIHTPATHQKMAISKDVVFSADKDFVMDNGYALINKLWLSKQEDGSLSLHFSLQNLKTSPIRAIYIGFQCSDMLGNPCGDMPVSDLLDLEIQPLQISDHTLQVPDVKTRNCIPFIQNIVYHNQEIYKNQTQELMYTLEPQEPLQLGVLQEAFYKRATATYPQARQVFLYTPREDGKFWHCACGQLTTADACPNCKCTKAEILDFCDVAKITAYNAENQ